MTDRTTFPYWCNCIMQFIQSPHWCCRWLIQSLNYATQFTNTDALFHSRSPSLQDYTPINSISREYEDDLLLKHSVTL